jgi:hypothetical protein
VVVAEIGTVPGEMVAEECARGGREEVCGVEGERVCAAVGDRGGERAG